MRRAGHKSSDAAMRYQHATSDRDAALAEALSAMARKAEVKPMRRKGSMSEEQDSYAAE
jgi:hypothetical protein